MPNLHLTLLSGSRAGELVQPQRDVLLLGSLATCDLVLTEGQVSEEHCRVTIDSEAVRLEDLESEHGTIVVRSGKELEVISSHPPAFELQDGDIIRLCGVGGDKAELEVHLLEEEEPHVVSVRPLNSLGARTGSNERNAELLSSLSRVHSRLNATSDLDQALEVIAEAALTLVPRATHATLVLRDSESGKGRGVYLPVLSRVRSGDGSAVPPTEKPAATRSVFRKVVRERAAVLATDAPSEAFSSESLLGANIKSTIGVPLWRGDDILGVLQVDNRDRPALFDTIDLEALAILTTNASLTIDNARLIQRLTIAEQQLRQENQYLKNRDRARRAPHEIIGSSSALAELMKQLGKVADTRVSVLIEGETGSGKELIAEALHFQSRRNQRLFVAQNCAALPKDLLESELFGHKRGAFTGATEDKRGLFELADGGTLFLDEVSELPLGLQAKLLRALQEREIRPLGSTFDKRVDVRVVAACNRNLETEVREGRFREDLYYRLSVFPLKVPPLRERQSDIPLLAAHFLKRYTQEYNNPVLGFSEDALEQLSAYAWPGNVRELENEVQRLVIQADPGGYISASLLSDRVRGAQGGTSRSITKGTLKQMVEQFERQLVSESLEHHSNNKTQAAKALGITREGLHKKLKQLGLD